MVAGALFLAAIWGGIRAYSLTHSRPPAGQRVAVGTASAPNSNDLSFAEGPAVALKIPEHLPRFSLNDLNGVPQSSDAWSGKSLVLNFWATWCAPCQREIPLLNSLSKNQAAEPFTVIGIAVDQPKKVRQFVDDFKIGYPILVGEQDALDLASQLGVASPAFPFSVFVDRSGELVTLFVGELHRPQAALILSVLRSLDAHAVDLPSARLQIAAGLEQLAAAGT